MSWIVERLRRLPWAGLGVELAVVYGSAVWGRRPRDVDLLVFVGEGVDGEEAAVRVAELVEEAVGLEADVYVVTDESDANCFLLLEAARGVIVYQTPRGRWRLVKAVNVCNDFMISRRRVRYTETLVGRVLGGAP